MFVLEKTSEQLSICLEERDHYVIKKKRRIYGWALLYFGIFLFLFLSILRLGYFIYVRQYETHWDTGIDMVLFYLSVSMPMPFLAFAFLYLVVKNVDTAHGLLMSSAKIHTLKVNKREGTIWSNWTKFKKITVRLGLPKKLIIAPSKGIRFSSTNLSTLDIVRDPNPVAIYLNEEDQRKLIIDYIPLVYAEAIAEEISSFLSIEIVRNILEE